MAKNVTYGIWRISRDYPEGSWETDTTGRIIHTDLLGIAKAYQKMLHDDKAKVVIIGYDGTPMEIG